MLPSTCTVGFVVETSSVPSVPNQSAFSKHMDLVSSEPNTAGEEESADEEPADVPEPEVSDTEVDEESTLEFEHEGMEPVEEADGGEDDGGPAVDADSGDDDDSSGSGAGAVALAVVLGVAAWLGGLLGGDGGNGGSGGAGPSPGPDSGI